MSKSSAGFLALSVLAAAAAVAQTAPPASRGQLLYTTNCISCHNTQMHWRDHRKATDWTTLKAEVRRWQGNAGLQWEDADIEEVARHLNDTIYRYPRTPDQIGLAPPPRTRPGRRGSA